MLPGAVCVHVGSQGRPALKVVHDRPLDEDLTGWQITCGQGNHQDADVRLTDLDRFIERDKSLRDLRATLPEGRIAIRQAPDQPWVVEDIEPVTEGDA